MPHRYFTTQITNGRAVLEGEDAHHLAHVMRARLGEQVVLCDGHATEYTATITGFGADCVEFSVEEGYPTAAEPRLELTLFAACPKQDKLEQILQHGTELGVTHFVPFFSRYCIAAPKNEAQKNLRYNRIVREAAKQAGRGVLPDVALPLPDFGAVCRALPGYDAALFFYECGGMPLRAALAPFVRAAEAEQDAARADGCGAKDEVRSSHRPRIALITGAEGGFSPAEAQAAADAGARTVGLGPRILRCETAPLAALAAVLALSGDLE